MSRAFGDTLSDFQREALLPSNQHPRPRKRRSKLLKGCSATPNALATSQRLLILQTGATMYGGVITCRMSRETRVRTTSSIRGKRLLPFLIEVSELFSDGRERTNFLCIAIGTP